MDISQRFCVRWNSYKLNLQTAFPKLLTSEHFVDVTLACEKQFIKCHKIVLSACSVYFETLLVNNPCQHPIIFMKDIEFWEIKALVEFMYKGEVNVSQNQLDSLLKSAESLQIRGLSGTKQFVNFEQSDDKEEQFIECKSKRNRNESEEEDDRGKKKKKKSDDDKSIQITSVKEEESVNGKNVEENDDETQKIVKEETIDPDLCGYESACMDPGEVEEPIEDFSQNIYYADSHNAIPGPSGISDLCSLALNHVECVMDQEKFKSANSTRNTTKCVLRHQEHNYTNPPLDETLIQKVEAADVTFSTETPKSKSGGTKLGTSSQSKNDNNNTRQNSQPATITPLDRTNAEPKSKVIKKDVFNRIRRSEEELQKAAEMVRGGMTFQTASDTFNIPISTIRFYMARRGILPQRRRGRGSSGVRDDDLIHPPFEIIHYRLPDIDKPL